MSPAQKSFILNDAVYYEIITALGIPKCDTSDESAWEDVNFSRLGHCRVLIDFFSGTRDKSKKEDRWIWSDDVLSEDYGFNSKRFDFPPDVEERLNKDLFHLTYARLRHKGSEQEWPDEYLREIHKRCSSFVERLLEDSTWKALLEREKWGKLLCLLKSGRELRISRPDRGKPWRVEAGDVLPGGYSTFTGLQYKSGLVDLTVSTGPQSNAAPCYAAVTVPSPKK